MHRIGDHGRQHEEVGEYGYNSHYFRRMLDAGAVDVLQADITRYQGLSGLLEAGAVCASQSLRLSAHAAPWLHARPMCAVPSARGVEYFEYFHGHVRIGKMIIEGLPEVVDGCLRPDFERAGNGPVLRDADARRFAL